MNSPLPEQIKQSRKDARLTQTQAAALIYKTCRAWQKWEAGEIKMDAAFFELFLIKSGKK
jgi:DNA-binding transcriptional regulator YiaG